MTDKIYTTVDDMTITVTRFGSIEEPILVEINGAVHVVMLNHDVFSKYHNIKTRLVNLFKEKNFWDVDEMLYLAERCGTITIDDDEIFIRGQIKDKWNLNLRHVLTPAEKSKLMDILTMKTKEVYRQTSTVCGKVLAYMAENEKWGQVELGNYKGVTFAYFFENETKYSRSAVSYIKDGKILISAHDSKLKSWEE